MSEDDYCLFGEGYCKWCRYCIIKYKEDQTLTDDQLFGETDFEEENQRLRRENEQLKSELNDCTSILYSVFEELNDLKYIQSNPITLKLQKVVDDLEDLKKGVLNE